MKKSSRLYLKNKQFILWNRQSGVFLPVATAFAPIAVDLIGKIIGRGKRKRTAKKWIKINYPKMKFTKNNRRRK